jgi:protein gp37
MSEKTAIAWCDSTLNCWEGCTKISEGCANCYAATRDQRFHRGKHWGPCAPRLNHVASATVKALAWNKKPWVCDGCGEATNIEQAHWCVDKIRAGQDLCFHRRRVFSLSLGDWLDPEVPVKWLADMLDVIRRCPDLDFLLLTKRPENFVPRLSQILNLMGHHLTLEESFLRVFVENMVRGWGEVQYSAPEVGRQNYWLGVSVENQEAADRRIPELLRIPAKVRFLSVEPLLEPIALQCALPSSLSDADDQFVDWVIVGGESGPKARPCNVEWIRSVVRQCADASVPCFVKQMGRKPILPDGTTAWLCDRAGADPAEWPADLRVQQFPTVSR